MSDINNPSLTLNGFITQNSEIRWQSWLKSRASLGSSGIEANANSEFSPKIQQCIQTAFGLSSFVADSLEKSVPIIEGVWPLQRLADPFDWVLLQENLTRALAKLTVEAQAKQVLRQWRRHLMLFVAIRNFSRITTIEQDFSDISRIADLLLSSAYDWLLPQMHQQWGKPLQSNGDLGNLIVVAMGKYGGMELNFSSDIDLIFYYSEDGITQEGVRSLEHQTFFIRLGQRLIALLGDLTSDGLVYRIDMRLRPYGDGGPLAMSFAAAEDYYQDQGREWERFAMVKSRVVIGSDSEKSAFYRLVKPFVFRRYIDFGVLDSIREIKTLITHEVKRKQMHNNIKLGKGGIREAEFVVQALQLIRGGRLTELQQRGFLQALQALTKEQFIPGEVCENIKLAYLFLRRAEHVLQQLEDQQTQCLPTDSSAQALLAFAMNFPDFGVFHSELQKHQQVIHHEFSALFAQPTGVHQSTNALEKIQLDQLGDDTIKPWLEDLNDQQISEIQSLLSSFIQSSTYQRLSERGKNRLSVLIPQLLLLMNDVDNPNITVTRVLNLIKAIHKRTAYLVLLAENPPILEQLVKLSSQSRWISERLVEFPVLLDELLYSSTTTLEVEDLQQELRRQLLRIEPEDDEQQQEQLRVFKQTNELRVAAACISDVMDIRKSSRLLSCIAESIIDSVMMIAWKSMCRRHGVPDISNASYDCLHGFAVIAYGKLGGEELGFGSDLDLVFLYQADPDSFTQGIKGISHAQFFTRLAQRVIHLLNIRTLSGVLYEVDTRLRPSGNSGLLVSHNLAFAEYQINEAWTWEHQALIRARGVCGDAKLIHWFSKLRGEVLQSAGKTATLKSDVLSMRQKMKSNLDKSTPDMLDIKQGLGGIVDIEFLVQYLVLQNAPQRSEIQWATRTTLLLQQLQDAGVLTVEVSTSLINAYRYYRRENNRKALMGEKKLLSLTHSDLPNQSVIKIWNQFLA